MILLLFDDADAHLVSWNCAVDEYDTSVDPGNALTLERSRFDRARVI